MIDELLWDDARCYHCAGDIPEYPEEGTPEWYGFCSEQCRTENEEGIVFKPWEPELDAYGHLNWTVGNENWIACLDVDISPDGFQYAYHVMVDCESGGFTETPETGFGPIDEIESIRGLPNYWYGVFYDVGYRPGEDPRLTEEDDLEFERVQTSWNKHIDYLKEEAQKRRDS